MDDFRYLKGACKQGPLTVQNLKTKKSRLQSNIAFSPATAAKPSPNIARLVITRAAFAITAHPLGLLYALPYILEPLGRVHCVNGILHPVAEYLEKVFVLGWIV